MNRWIANLRMPFSRDKNFYKTFFRLTFIIALQNCIGFGVNLTDNIMLGNYSEYALSGATISNQVQFLLQMMTAGIGEGIVVLCSQYWGKRKVSPIHDILSSGLKIGLILSTLLTVTVFLFPAQTLSLFTDKETVITEGVKYIRIVCFSYIMYCLGNIFISALRSVEVVRLGLLVAVVALLLNIVLNYALIYGHFGLPELGSAGAALATVISRIIEFFIILIYVFFIDDRMRYKTGYFFRHNRELFVDYVKTGLPVILSSVIWALGSGAQMAILGRLDEEVISASSISTTVFQILSVIVYGSASTAGVMTGKSIGSADSVDDLEDIKRNTRTFQVIFLLLGLFTCAAILSLKGVILSFYDISEKSRELTNTFINVLSITTIGTAYEMSCLSGVVRGGGDTKFVLYNDMIFVWLVVIPSAAIAAFFFNASPLVVFICLKSDQILKCFVAVVHINRYKWVKKLTRETLR